MRTALTKTEARYLELLFATPEGVPMAKFLGDAPRESGRNLVARHIADIRRKLKGRYAISSVRGFGYKIALA